MHNMITALSIIQNIMSGEIFLCLLLWVCGLYLGLIGPAIFNIWIMPNIEKRYSKKLCFNQYFSPFPRWGLSVYLIPGYILFKSWQWTWLPFFKKSNPLGDINFDIKTATRFEIIMSYISIIFFAMLISTIICLCIFY